MIDTSELISKGFLDINALSIIILDLNDRLEYLESTSVERIVWNEVHSPSDLITTSSGQKLTLINCPLNEESILIHYEIYDVLSGGKRAFAITPSFIDHIEDNTVFFTDEVDLSVASNIYVTYKF